MTATGREDEVLGFCRDAIDRYERYARRNMTQFYLYQVLAIVLTAATSVLVASKAHLGDGVTGAIVVASLPAMATICASATSLFQFQAKWISARASCEAIRQELDGFRLRAGAYRDLVDAQALDELARRALDVVRGETAHWRSIVEAAPKPGTGTR